MKTDDINLTVEELSELCRLYMDSKLTVLEEKELEFILLATAMDSPDIEAVRSLVGIKPVKSTAITPLKKWNWNPFAGIAASVSVMIMVAVSLTVSDDSHFGKEDHTTYIAAYSHGKLLKDREAEVATELAMSKADSLMNYASLAEREYILKANEIISETLE